MWPWEHLALGYLLYSTYSRLIRGEPPATSDTLVLVFATQLPDLIDKPLSWGLGVLPSGLSLGHSLLFATPACLLVLAVTIRLGRGALGSAFTVGYLSHLTGDLLYPIALGGWPDPRFLLWPVTSSAARATEPFFDRVVSLWETFAVFTATPRGRLYLLVEGVFIVVMLVLWVSDGRPGLGFPGRGSDV